ncbi:TetR/AcrR family transcriptional regulator [Halostreptopolyspora alba]|uniref:TetR/AcrR family transcriptional regulator n=1 Tax=Halostreptopolyspora alba TaxID=2487137 RepID=A0A3N0E4V3_9ACTN|nr:TetR/AcrR family transcriptional regulator [Nocardiopsaceae bacterium YIM 96095]
MPRRENDTRNRIRETALELFASQGADKTSLREIAERLDITKAALYYHFPSKNALLHEMVQPLVEDVEALLDDAERAGEPLSPRELLGRYFDVTARHSALYLALLHDLGTLIELDVVSRIFTWRDRLQWLLIGRAASPAEVAACTLAVGGLQDCAVTTDGGPVSGEYREATIDAACRALGVDSR